MYGCISYDSIFRASLRKQPTFPDATTGFQSPPPDMTSEKRAYKFQTDDLS